MICGCFIFVSFFFWSSKRTKRREWSEYEWNECNEWTGKLERLRTKVVERTKDSKSEKILRERDDTNRPHAQSWRDLQQKVGLNQRSEHQAHWQEWDSPIRRWNALGLTRSISEGADRRAELKRAHLRHGAVESSWMINVEETIWSCDDLIILIASTVGWRSTVRSKVVGEFQDTLGGRSSSF